MGEGLERFIDLNVRTLVSWEILVFFDRHRDTVLDQATLAERLGRRLVDITPDVEALCDAGVLQRDGELVRLGSDPEVDRQVTLFAAACADPASRAAILGRVLSHVDAASGLQSEDAVD